MMSQAQRAATIMAPIGLIGCAVGLLIDPKAMLASYLAVWFAVSAIPMGALSVLFTSYLVRGGWTYDLHASLTSAALTIPVFAVLFLPVLFGLHWIYPWAAGGDSLPAFKAVYLTPWFFALRTICYFAIWTALAVWAVRAYGKAAAMVRAASAGLIVWTLTVSWAGVDWLESVEPHFHSSTYGLLTVSFALLAGFCFPVAARLSQNRPRRMSNAAYSGVLLSILLLWAYLHAMQYIIIWTGNIPDEVDWYAIRLEGDWRFVLWGLFIWQFVLPFFVLLSETARSSTKALLWLAGTTLVLRLIEAIVLVVPPLDVAAAALMLGLPAASLVVGSIAWLAWHAAEPLVGRWSGRPAAAQQHQRADAAAER